MEGWEELGVRGPWAASLAPAGARPFAHCCRSHFSQSTVKAALSHQCSLPNGLPDYED